MNESVQEIEDHLREHARSGASIEAMVRMLRDAGFSQVRSMRLLANVGIMTFGEAKEVVANSPSWTDNADTHETLVSAGIDALARDEPSQK